MGCSEVYKNYVVAASISTVVFGSPDSLKVTMYPESRLKCSVKTHILVNCCFLSSRLRPNLEISCTLKLDSKFNRS